MSDPANPQLKSALWSAVSDLVDTESIKQNRNATPQYIGALADMVWTQIGMFPGVSTA